MKRKLKTNGHRIEVTIKDIILNYAYLIRLIAKIPSSVKDAIRNLF